MINKIRTWYKNYKLFQKIGIKDYCQDLFTLFDLVSKDLKEFLDKSKDTKSPKKLVLVSIERGGNIPSTFLNYQISKAFKEELVSNQLQLHFLHIPISTRDKKSSPNVMTIPKLEREIKSILKNSPEDVSNSKIYFIDDLLDSGATLQLLHNTLCRVYWYSAVNYVFCYTKADPKVIVDSYYLDGDYIPGKHSKIIVAKNLKTSKWLDFWYD